MGYGLSAVNFAIFSWGFPAGNRSMCLFEVGLFSTTSLLPSLTCRCHYMYVYLFYWPCLYSSFEVIGIIFTNSSPYLKRILQLKDKKENFIQRFQQGSNVMRNMQMFTGSRFVVALWFKFEMVYHKINNISDKMIIGVWMIFYVHLGICYFISSLIALLLFKVTFLMGSIGNVYFNKLFSAFLYRKPG